MNIIDQIKALELYRQCEVYLPFGPTTDLTTADLIALAESHERLLEAAKDYLTVREVSATGRGGGLSTRAEKLRRLAVAASEAEKL